MGLGIQGRKRVAACGADVVATVDPAVSDASHRRIDDVPPADFDAALLCTGDGPKLDLLRRLISGGKHVLVEKPLLAPEAGVYAELRDLTRRSRVACYTAYNHRFEPTIERMKALLDQNAIGAVYLAKLHYGNGTARDSRNSPWRDRGIGVVSDLGSHLLDLTVFLLGDQRHRTYDVRCLNRFENRAYDHAILISRGTPMVELEMSLICWRNTFVIDLFGELGSLHLHGLCKWGFSTLTIRKRVLPSGRPSEETERAEGPDPTWAKEYRYFQELCRTAGTRLDQDAWIHSVLSGVPEREPA